MNLLQVVEEVFTAAPKIAAFIAAAEDPRLSLEQKESLVVEQLKPLLPHWSLPFLDSLELMALKSIVSIVGSRMNAAGLLHNAPPIVPHGNISFPELPVPVAAHSHYTPIVQAPIHQHVDIPLPAEEPETHETFDQPTAASTNDELLNP